MAKTPPRSRQDPPEEPTREGAATDDAAAPATDAAAPATRPGPGSLPVVGLGASAGGLEALKQFFSHLPTPNGVAFVVVTHQHPGHTSMLPELLGRHTEMPVGAATSGTKVEADHVYVSPPGANLAILEGKLQVLDTNERAHLRLPIDHFFRSLARDQHERAIGVVLSGTGTDGTLGLKEIKGASGMVMVQDERSALYAGMPHSAIATEVVDYVLPVEELPAQLLAYVRGPYLTSARPRATELLPSEAMQQIFLLLRSRTGHDFSDYKTSTISRRIERRMNVHHLDSAASYARTLRAHPTEVDALFKELLIGVTSFFRDPEAFEALASALPDLLASRPDDHVFRVWVPGCATGEEAYSLAILIRECMEQQNRHMSVQIFATDLDARAIDVARAGSYPDGIAVDVPPKRLERYFLKEEGCYQVKPEIREMLVFAPQNLIEDPPFTKLDLLSCRNLLIYFNATLQKRLLPVFHYALRPSGLLFLGSSEALGTFGHLFEALDKKWKIFRRREVPTGSYTTQFPAVTLQPHLAAEARSAPLPRNLAGSVPRLAEKLLLRQLVPPSVLVEQNGNVVHVHGRTGLYLEPAQGPQAAANILGMARPGLRIHLGAALREAATLGAEVVRRGVGVKTNGEVTPVDVTVRPVSRPEPLRGLFLVSFEPSRQEPLEAEGNREERSDGSSARMAQLERELEFTKESHQATIEELETTNEELKSTNEELQSANEELQSTNEELETSKEEMHSLNEELQTVNSELQGKVEELSRTNDDMKNLLNGTNIATVFLDDALRIKRFTEQATQLIRMIPADVGRPIGDLVQRFHYTHLEADAREVLRTLVPKEIEVRGEGTSFLMRILPYRTTQNLIDGLVLTFFDITRFKELQERETQLQDVLRGSPTCVCGQDRELRYIWACSSGVLGRAPESVIGQSDADLLPADQAAALTRLKRRVLETGRPAREELRLTVDAEIRTLDLHVEPVRDANGICGVACVYTDLTDRAPQEGQR